MKNIREDFIELINDKSKSAEDIFDIMYRNHKDNFSTKSILRGRNSWRDCMYQGTIGEKDFIVAEASSSSLDFDNIEMIYDDYKKTMIKFINYFRQEYEKDHNQHPISIMINISNIFLDDVFSGTSRNGEYARSQRNQFVSLDEINFMKKYNISSQKSPNRVAVCCERNVTIGNAFQFMGFETYHVAGWLSSKDDDILNGHAFTLIKYGNDEGKYALFDLFNGVIIKNVLPGNYDFTKGFVIEHYIKHLKKTYIYQVAGPLFEMTNEIFEVEKNIRVLYEKLIISEGRYKHNLEIEEDLDYNKIRQEFLILLDAIKKSNMNDVFKNRYINRIEGNYLKVIEKIEEKYGNTSNIPHGK